MEPATTLLISQDLFRSGVDDSRLLPVLAAPAFPGLVGQTAAGSHQRSAMVSEIELPGTVTLFDGHTPLGIAATFFLGVAPPLQLVLANEQCSTGDPHGSAAQQSPVAEHLAPVFLALRNGAVDIADFVRVADASGLPLWHPAVARRRLLLVADPRCAYNVK